MTYFPVTNTAAEQLLFDLVSISSISRHEEHATQCLTDWMSAHGYDESFVDPAGNAVGIKGNGSREIVLLGHIDTFPGNPPVHVDGRLLYGRGSVDAKGPLATFAVAGANAHLPSDVRLIVIGAVEEEAATSKGARYAATQYSPEACIIGEPSNWDRICLGYKGRLLLRWQWEGGMTHSAGQDASPADQAFEFYRRVHNWVTDFNVGRESIFNRLDITIRDINTIQEDENATVVMTLGFRLPPKVALEDIVSNLPSDNDNAKISTYGEEVAFVADKDNLLTRAFRKAIRNADGKPRFVTKTGTADMNVVGPIWNCPIVAYGPGDSALDHTPHEHIDLDEYLRATRVLQQVLESL